MSEKKNDIHYPGEGLLEEETIMEERARPGRKKVLDNTVVRAPIKTLALQPPMAIDKGAMAAEAIRLMQDHHRGCVLVVEKGMLVGIFTERDILYKILGTGRDPAHIPIDQVMTANPEALTPEESIAFALNRMSVGGFRHVPIVDKNRRPLGIVSIKDIVEYLVEFFPDEVLNLPPRPELIRPGEREGA